MKKTPTTLIALAISAVASVASVALAATPGVAPVPSKVAIPARVNPTALPPVPLITLADVQAAQRQAAAARLLKLPPPAAAVPPCIRLAGHAVRGDDRLHRADGRRDLRHQVRRERCGEHLGDGVRWRGVHVPGHGGNGDVAELHAGPGEPRRHGLRVRVPDTVCAPERAHGLLRSWQRRGHVQRARHHGHARLHRVHPGGRPGTLRRSGFAPGYWHRG